MAGKYDKLKGKLPAFEQEPSFQQKVDEAKQAHQAKDMSELAKTFSSVRQTKNHYEEMASSLNVELEALSQMLNDSFEAQGMSKFTLQSGETCFQQIEPYSSVIDKELLMKFIKKEKMQDMLSLPWQTMNGINKERLLAGKPEMPGTTAFSKVSIRLRGNGMAAETDS